MKRQRWFITFTGFVVVLSLLLWVRPTPAYTQDGSTEMISVASDGTKGNARSRYPSLSADGRYVVFVSEASNLVEHDTNGLRDCFLRDRQTGTTTRISVASDGTQGNGAVTDNCFISGDGRYVAFSSFATNLVTEATYAAWSSAFVHDNQTGITALVSRTYDGAPANWPSAPGALSYDGRYITFWSVASNLLPNDGVQLAHIYVYDQTEQSVTRVSKASDGAAANANSYGSCISGDGRYVAFSSLATNLVPDDTNDLFDVFIHDRDRGTTTRIQGINGAEANGESGAHGQCMSEDGRYIAFDSEATNLITNDTNGRRDTFVYDQQLGQATRVSVASNGTEANNPRWLHTPTLSFDGRYAAFESTASNLVADDTNNYLDVFVHDLDTHVTTRVSLTSSGEQGNYGSMYGVVSGNGRFVTFESDADNLVVNDNNGVGDVFIHERSAEIATNNVIFVSSTVGGRIGGVRFADEDILAYNLETGVWSKYFDGSRVGLVRNDINAFTLLDDGSILLSFNSPQVVPGLGWVTDADIVKFTAAEVQAGIPVSSRFAWYLDGSDVGLQSGHENIDSISLTADGRLLISTRGPFAASGVRGNDEDLFVLNDATFGAASAGHWALYFDGSDVGLNANSEDVKGAWLDPTTGALYLATEGWFAVAGLSGDANDIFLCTPGALGDNTQCTFSLFWDGAKAGFGRGRLDGLALGNSDQLAASTLLNNSGDDLNDATIDDTEEDADDIDPFGDEAEGDAQTHQLFLPVMTR